MRIAITYMAQMKAAAGTSSETVELGDGSTLGDLTAHLAAAHGHEFSRLLLTGEGVPRDTILIFAGDEHIEWDPARPLRDGEEVTILSPIAGG